MTDVVCGVIEDSDGRLLACRRAEGKHLGGLWEFPGGKVEAGESLAEALIRELREELGIDVRVGAPLKPVIWDYGRGAIRLLPFRCGIAEGEPRAIEHAEIRWCAAEDLSLLKWANADVPVLREIATFLQ